MSDTYTCAACDGVFSFDWTEEEALAEKEKNWGDMPIEDMAIVCDDCYREMMGLAPVDEINTSSECVKKTGET